MNAPTPPIFGTVGWFDLTVENAEQVRDFYAAVVGWKWSPVKMKGYDDYCMDLPEGGAVAGICHQRDVNAGMPSQWLLYVNVPDLSHCLDRVRDCGGRVLAPVRGEVGKGRFAVIADPAGAVMALYEPPKA